MSPSAKSKSKDKKTGKEASKASSKSSNHLNTGAGVPANGYNPLLGTFHAVDTAPFSTPRVQANNGRYQTIEETDDRSVNSFGTVVECDSISNTGSWSGESEDHKDRASQQQPPRQEAVPPGADNDKREKVRQKNEKKHQRQKERRNAELHERCCGYLTSRKLKALAQQLVSMGFSQERATNALIRNEGRVEESVAWLFEGGEEEGEGDNNKTSEQNIGNKKIDISEELARIAEMENRCKCSRQEVERAVVACEGDLEKAEEYLMAQREEPPSVPPKPDRTDDPPFPGNNNNNNNGKLPVVSSNQNLTRIQLKTAPPSATTILQQQQQRNDRDFNYTKLAGPSVVDPGNRPSERIQPKPDWAKPQHITLQTEKRWPVAASGPAVHTLAQPTKPESGYVSAGSEVKNHQLQPGSIREASLAGKMASGTSVGQSVAGKMASSSSSVDTAAMGGGWSTNNKVEILKPNGFIPSASETRTINSGTVGRNQFYNQFPSYQQPSQTFISNGITLESMGMGRGNMNGSLPRNSANTPTIAAASSLGLFSPFGGGSGSSSSLDWNSGGSVIDYSNIDWSLERGSGGSGLWPGAMHAANSMQYDTRTYDTYTSNMGGSNMGGLRPPPSPSMMRPPTGLSNGGSFRMGLHGGGSEMPTGGSSRHWASPFEERDIFSLQRNFASSPSVEHLGEYMKRMNNK